MESVWNEASYPLSFRKEEAQKLGGFIHLRHNVEIIGMKRVGISNFLRFFLYHPDITSIYISKTEKHFFIPVDCNDLIEREVFAFWMLTFKRLVDAVEKNTDISEKTKTLTSDLFLSSIQSNDLFLTVENIRRAVVEIGKENIFLTFFLIRFDRIKNSVNQEFFANLAGLQEASGQHVCYVFTCYKPLEDIMPEHSTDALTLLHELYLQPADTLDRKIIFETLEKRYHLKQPRSYAEKIIELSGGHIQYLQLCLVILNHKMGDQIEEKDLQQLFSKDERVILLSEEIWESLSDQEQEVLLKMYKKQTMSDSDEIYAKYLFASGIVQKQDSKLKLFNSFFEEFIQKKEQNENTSDVIVELTKKEHLLYSYLFEHLDQICERDGIIEAVWAESEEFGVSDWTIDRLTARLRTKLKKQNSKYAIVTVKTRGYKMIEEIKDL